MDEGGIMISTTVIEYNMHRYNLDAGKFTPAHAEFYATRAAKHDLTDLFIYDRVCSHLMSGSMTPADIPRRHGDVWGAFDS